MEKTSISYHMQSSDTFVSPMGIAPAFLNNPILSESSSATISFRDIRPDV